MVKPSPSASNEVTTNDSSSSASANLPQIVSRVLLRLHESFLHNCAQESLAGNCRRLPICRLVPRHTNNCWQNCFTSPRSSNVQLAYLASPLI